MEISRCMLLELTEGECSVSRPGRFIPGGKRSWFPWGISGRSEEEKILVRFEVFTAVTTKNGVFWDVTPCGS
jgi:hypothetical protein